MVTGAAAAAAFSARGAVAGAAATAAEAAPAEARRATAPRKRARVLCVWDGWVGTGVERMRGVARWVRGQGGVPSVAPHRLLFVRRVFQAHAPESHGLGAREGLCVCVCMPREEGEEERAATVLGGLEGGGGGTERWSDSLSFVPSKIRAGRQAGH